MTTLTAGMGGETPRWSDLAAMARAAEDLGFDSVWVGDRLLGDGEHGMWECTTLLAALARETSRVEIGSLVIRAIYRNPALTAKIANTLDEISGGRFVLGLGVGPDGGENERLGYPEDHPIGRFEEALAIIRGLLRCGNLNFEGTYYRVRDWELEPRGPSEHGPPVLVAARTPRVLRLAARNADLWQTYLSYRKDDQKEIVRQQEEADAACEAEGRDPATLERTGFVQVDASNRPEGSPVAESLEKFGYGGPPISGGPEEIADAFRVLAGLGFSQLHLWPTPNSLGGIEVIGRALEILDRG